MKYGEINYDGNEPYISYREYANGCDTVKHLQAVIKETLPPLHRLSLVTIERSSSQLSLSFLIISVVCWNRDFYTRNFFDGGERKEGREGKGRGGWRGLKRGAGERGGKEEES